MTIGSRSEIARSTEDVIPGPGTTISNKTMDIYAYSGTSKVSWLLYGLCKVKLEDFLPAVV